MHLTSTIALAVALAAPATAHTAPVAAPQLRQQRAVSQAQTSAADHTIREDKTADAGGARAREGRESLVRLQGQARQLGAAQ